jgi:hypothetical protein
MARVVVLHVSYSVRASYYQDWLDAFLAHDGIDCVPLNIFSYLGRGRVTRELKSADLAVVLHSGTGDTLDYVRKISGALKDRRCPLVVFMGNEFNMPWLPFEERRQWLTSVQADLVATQLLADTGRWLYEGTGARVVSIPHALNPRIFSWRIPRQNRTISIGSRSFPYSVYVGNRSRNLLLERVRAIGPSLGLNCDIETDRRLQRDDWAHFLNQCRFTVATEAGASHLDRDDELAAHIQNFLTRHRSGLAIRPNSAIRGVARYLPWSFRERLYALLNSMSITHEAIENDPALQQQVIDRFFASRRPPPHYGGCISSRHFDAIGCGTAQLLVEGRYNDILEAGKHYISIKQDLSNLESVLEQTKDPSFGDDVALAAHTLAFEKHTLDHRVKAILDSSLQ